MGLFAPRNFYVLAHLVLVALIVSTYFVILPVPLQMLSYTGAILYIGSHHSLAMFEVDPETSELPQIESVSTKDALLFPIIGSLALLSMYVAYKFFGQYWTNMVLTTYVTLIGIVAVAETIRPMIEPFLPGVACKNIVNWKFRAMKIAFGVSGILSYLLGILTCAGFLYTKHWTLHNILAISFGIQAVSIISLGRFPIAVILFIGFLCYDVFWVFGTDVMSEVASQFSGPIKLLLPAGFGPAGGLKKTILGLGDIVIPGIFLALCLRFDGFLHKAALREKGAEIEVLDPFTPFRKAYFWNVWVSYLLGLGATHHVMFQYNKAQPVLLYVAPCMVATVILTSICRWQLKAMLTYNEAEVAQDLQSQAGDAKEPADSVPTENKKDQ